MDKFRALKILHLGKHATREEAKAAFRALAKQFHPDRAGPDPARQIALDHAMKEINLAYRYIVPLLPSRPVMTEKQSSSDTKKGSLENSLSNYFSRIRRFSKRLKKKKPSPGPGRSFHASKPTSRSMPSNSSGSQQFEAVLKRQAGSVPFKQAKIIKQTRAKTGEKSSRPSPVSYENWARYMELKQQMKTRRTRSSKDRGRVEKITPVRPVPPVDRGY